jgi:3,4-dihydroxy 2-butanone 4-phosphate synthase/GTP cyclohydrolase II
MKHGEEMSIDRVLAAIEEIKKGNMIIMMDDEDRENEGDLVYAAAFSTPEKVNFMASEAKGLICVAITREDAQRMDLKPMVAKNSSSYETAFTVSVDAKGCATGISAYERDDTIKLLADPNTRPDDFVRPGHIFPLIAKDGGVLVRTGHTEGSVDICRLAGVYPAGVICEIMKEDGTMARRDDLEKFAVKHNLKIVFVSDLIEYRLKREKLVKEIASENSSFMCRDVVQKRFEDHTGKVHTAFIFGTPKETANVRFNNISTDIELLSNESRFTSLTRSVDLLAKEGGVIIFMDASHPESSEVKEFGVGAQILGLLGIKKINLLTHSKNKEFVGISGFGLSIENKIEV